MIIPIELRFKADKDSKSAFRTDKTIKSHDVNSVEFHITIEGLELTADHTAKILSIFHSSKSQSNVDCEIVEGKIIYKPDTNLITRHEHVTNYVYVYKGNQSLDVREFIYVVDLSKMDETSLEVKEVYDQSYADLLADFEQALSDYKDSLPQADSVRAEIDVILNQFSEDSQAKLSQYDTAAQQVIADNQAAFDLAESARQEAFDTSQSARQESYEQTQSLINEAESSRVQAEGQRESAESSRVSAEAERVLAENERENTEDSRERSEGERKVNEEARELAESERENAEVQRKTDHANRSAEFDGKADKVVLNNLVPDGDFSDGLVGWAFDYGDGSISENQLNLTYNSAVTNMRARRPSATYNTDDVYYVSYIAKSSDGNTVTRVRRSTVPFKDATMSNAFKLYSTVTEFESDSHLQIEFYNSTSPLEGIVHTLDNVVFLNLTETFGAGNEPTKEETDELIKVTGYIDGEYALNNKEMLGHLMKGIGEKANKKQEEWITPTLLNGWYAIRPNEPPQYMKDEFGFVHFRGAISKGASATSNVPFHLPAGYRPDVKTSFGMPEIDTSQRAIAVSIFTNGIIDFAGARLESWYAISSITFKAV